MTKASALNMVKSANTPTPEDWRALITAVNRIDNTPEEHNISRSMFLNSLLKIPMYREYSDEVTRIMTEFEKP